MSTPAWLKSIDKRWTLFLDRDGVINEKLDNDYVKSIAEFQFLPRTLEALSLLSSCFGTIVVVTNQQGIGKGLMTEADLTAIHQYMLGEVFNHGGRIDQIFYCPGLAESNPSCRKPNTGMAFEAKEVFPKIDFRSSLMVGDSDSDMEFAERLGMQAVKIAGHDEKHLCMPSLFHLAHTITS